MGEWPGGGLAQVNLHIIRPMVALNLHMYICTTFLSVFSRCVPRDSISSGCGGRVRQLQRGFLMSRAYPKYYMGGQNCR